MTKAKRIIITLLILIGLALSVELCVVYYNSNFALDAKPSICAINLSLDCDSVARTTFSQFLGIPLSYLGVFLYLIFLFLTYVDKLKNVRFLNFLNVFKNPSSYIFCIGVFSFIVSMTLFGISWFKIDSLCIFCLMTYFVDFFIALTAKTKGISVLQEVKTTVQDFVDAIKMPKYRIAFVALCAIALGLVAVTATTDVFAPQVAAQKQMKKTISEINGEVDGTRLGPADAELVIHEYMDFNCGGCFFANLYLHRIVDEFENVAVVQHNLPLEGVCNHNVKDGGHENSCLKAAYALAAAKQNKYWTMGAVLFAASPKDEKEILEQARLVDLDIKKLRTDANSDEIKKEIFESIHEADSKNVTGTPTLFIGIKKQLGISSYPMFKEIVKQQGGREKKNVR